MQCYFHPDRSAVAQCSKCNRGICSECAHDVGGPTLCPIDFNSGISKEVALAKRRSVGAWVFTGVIGTFLAFGAVTAAFSPTSRGGQPIGPAALLLVPVAYYAVWSLYWGWGPAWRVTRRIGRALGSIGGIFGDLGEGIFYLIIILLMIEFAFAGAVLVGAFIGIPRYLQDRTVLARAPSLVARIP